MPSCERRTLQATLAIANNDLRFSRAKGALNHKCQHRADLWNCQRRSRFFSPARLLAPRTMSQSARALGDGANPPRSEPRSRPDRFHSCRAECTLRCGARLWQRERIPRAVCRLRHWTGNSRTSAPRWFGRACDNQRLFGANPFTVGLGDDARHGHFDDQRSMMGIANVDPHPSLRGKRRGPMTDLLERTFAPPPGPPRPNRERSCSKEPPADSARPATSIRVENSWNGPFHRPRRSSRAATSCPAHRAFPAPTHAASENGRLSARRTFAGEGLFASSGLNGPDGLAFDNSGNLYAANFFTNTIEEFNSSGVGTLFASLGIEQPHWSSL